MESPLVIRASRTKLRRAAVVLSLAALLGLGDTIFLSAGIGRVGFGLLTLFLGALAALAVRGFMGEEPLFVVGLDGIEHRTLGLIPWDDVADVRVGSGAQGRHLQIYVVDEKAYLRRARGPLAVAVRMNLRFGHGLLSFSERGFDLPVASLCAEIRARAPRALPG